jgi:hypothetical protein
MVEIVLNNSSGIYQVDGLLKAKLRGSGLEPYVEVIAHIDTEAEKRLARAVRNVIEPGDLVTYAHGDHIRTVEVLSVTEETYYGGFPRLRVFGAGGSEYWLDSNRVDFIYDAIRGSK